MVHIHAWRHVLTIIWAALHLELVRFNPYICDWMQDAVYALTGQLWLPTVQYIGPLDGVVGVAVNVTAALPPPAIPPPPPPAPSPPPPSPRMRVSSAHRSPVLGF